MSSNLGYSEVRTYFGLSCKSTKTELNSLVSYVSPLCQAQMKLFHILQEYPLWEKIKFAGHVRCRWCHLCFSQESTVKLLKILNAHGWVGV